VSAAREAAAARSGVGLFQLASRGVLAVEGGDRLRWLDGMLSNDLARLAPGAEHSGCRALALTRKGRIVADCHVWLRPEALWLETDAAALPGLLEQLGKCIIADDVVLRELGGAVVLSALEGPRAPDVFAAAFPDAKLPAPEACVALAEPSMDGVVVAAHGASGEPALRWIAPARVAAALEARLLAAGRGSGLFAGSPAAYEILRIEAGTPRFGAELDTDVLPAEAGLEDAISSRKGCYTGQEIVARVAARGAVRHALVGLRLGEPPAPEVGAPVAADAGVVGEVTSACVSAAVGAIALAFVRVEHREPGTALRVAGRPARVAALPFVATAVTRSGGASGGAG
jgi:folate-binding protein YgfZ